MTVSGMIMTAGEMTMTAINKQTPIVLMGVFV